MSPRGRKPIDYLTIPQYAERFKVHPRSVERWIKAGALKVVRKGFAVKIAVVRRSADKGTE